MENTTKVVTGKVRLSYVNVFEPKAIAEGETPKYSVCVMIPKTDKVTIEKINKAIEAAKQAGKSKIADKNGKIPANIKSPLRDGDIERGDDPPFEGHYFINAKSCYAPGVVDRDRNAILDKEEVYSGCYGRVSISFYAYNVPSKGIACLLNNVQKLEDGERLGGASSAEDDFAEDFDDLA
jgi:hypothetical protein